ncbi:unnamed protein product [Enterobius vermicularis]|uniref:BTB domain-containing protein n=1 Tax=Enterobius vermicularis TaxID=51028 RepID=A0A0N4VC28_ENTVE|nr:unnamed protein product [Enterobius vermicularis]
MLSCDTIQLNVGGTLYTTTKKTLSRESNTFFTNQLFSNFLRMSDGSFFIDRNGQIFSYILDYLRCGKLIVPRNFHAFESLYEEAKFYGLGELKKQIEILERRSTIPRQPTKSESSDSPCSSARKPGFLTLGYRGTFAFGRDGQTDVKFRKLYRILVCGKASLCREVFGDTLNESRDPSDREGCERYTSRLYLKHQCLEKACDTLAEKGFKLLGTCCNGANGLMTSFLPNIQSSSSTPELMNQRNGGDFEEQRWAHYTELIFYREPLHCNFQKPNVECCHASLQNLNWK